MNTMVYKSAPTAGQKIVEDQHYVQGKNTPFEKGIDATVGYAPYFVSALASDQKLLDVGRMNYWMSVLDVLVHVLIWIFALVFEILMWIESDKLKTASTPDTRTFPFATASLITFIVPASIVIISLPVHACVSKIAPGNFFPFLTAIIEGGLSSSILFTLICMLYTVGVASASGDWRDYTINLLIFKVMAASFINANVRRALNRD